jgi:hypothetical protein
MNKVKLVVLITACWLYLLTQVYGTSVYVKPDYTGEEHGTYEQPYTTVDNALYSIRNENTPYSIILYPGSYPPIEIIGCNHPRIIRSFFSPGNEHYIADTIIEGNSNAPAIRLQECSEIALIGLTIRNGSGFTENIDGRIAKYGGGISTKNIQKIQVQNCDIYNNIALAGAGIYMDVSYIQLSEIKNCNIHNNLLVGLANAYETAGAGIFIRTGRILIESTSIYDNNSDVVFGKGGGIANEGGASNGYYRVMDFNVVINKSHIYGNQTRDYGSALFFSFYLENIENGYAKLQIENSNIVNNYCSMFNNHAGAYLLLGNVQSFAESRATFEITNSIFWNNKYSGNNIDNQLFIGYWQENHATNPHPEWVKYNYIQRRIVNGQTADLLNIDESNIGNQLITPGISPCFIDPTNNNFSLQWNNAIKSPCIDAGYPELVDTLYNRIDIGAIEFNGFPHSTYTYTFPAITTNNGIKWMSFPVLYHIDNGQFTNTIEAGDFFTLENILYPDILERIDWNDVYQEQNHYQQIEFIQNWGNLNHIITSPQGYKVQMDALNEEERRIEVSGFLQELNTEIQLHGLHNGQYKENWLGYYYPESQHVFDAFNGFLDELWFIQTQHWTLIRQYSQLGGPWVGVLTPSTKPLVLSPGDMVVVKCFRDCDFTWGDFGPEWQPQPPLKPEHFEYLEKLEYIPIMTDFRNSNLELPKEIAVYVNGVCKGAAVVTDSLAQILAYICDDLPDNPELEFMLYYDSKSPVSMPAYEYWDSRTDTFRKDVLTLKDRQDYYLVQIKDSQAGETPLPRLYLAARPNPFNPATRLAYYLPRDSRVTLAIYNAKGQLVKTLVQGGKAAGMQSAEWDGRMRTASPAPEECISAV